MALPFKPHSITLYDVVDSGDAPPTDGTSVVLSALVTPLTPHDAAINYNLEIISGFEVFVDVHLTAVNKPLGGSFAVRDGQRVLWNDEKYVTIGGPHMHRAGLPADHLKFVMQRDNSEAD